MKKVGMLMQPDLSRNAGSVETECLMTVGDCVCLFFSTVCEKDCRKKTIRNQKPRMRKGNIGNQIKKQRPSET
jgi:hypothetical protein